MTTIDLHAHLLEWEAIAELRSLGPDFAPEILERDDGYHLRYPGREALGPIPAGMFDVDRRLEEMDGQRVGVQVLAVPPPEFHYHLETNIAQDFSRIHNDAAVAVSARHPDRFEVFATLPLQDARAAVRELERIAPRPQVRGIEIGTNVNGRNLDWPDLEPLWAALEALDLPVWVHPDQRAIAGGERLSEYYLRNLIGNPLETTIAIAALIFGGVLERHPSLRFGFVHGGGFAPYQIGRWDHGWGCRSESHGTAPATPSTYFKRMFFDSLTHDRLSLELLGRRVGWSQVLLGSDYPFDMAEGDPVASVEDLQLPDVDRDAVLAGNAARFLRPRKNAPTGSSSATARVPERGL